MGRGKVFRLHPHEAMGAPYMVQIKALNARKVRHKETVIFR